MVKFWDIVKKIFKTIWNVLKAIFNAIQNYMKSTWDKWDEEAGIKKKEEKKEIPKAIKKTNKAKVPKGTINLDEYDEFHFKRRKKGDKN